MLIITAKTKKFLKKYERIEFYPGVFQIKYKHNQKGDTIKLNFIVIEELEIIPANYSLLLFTKKSKLQEFFEIMLLDDKFLEKEEFIKYAIKYNTEEIVMAADAVQKEIDPQVKRNIMTLANYVGVEEIIKAIGKDKIIEAIGGKTISGKMKAIEKII